MNSCCNSFKFRAGGVSPSAITDSSVAHGHNSNSNNRGSGDVVQTGLHVWDSNEAGYCLNPFSYLEHEELCQPSPEGNQSPQRILPNEIQADCVDLGTLRDSPPHAVHGDLLCALPRTLQCPQPLESRANSILDKVRKSILL